MSSWHSVHPKMLCAFVVRAMCFGMATLQDGGEATERHEFN